MRYRNHLELGAVTATFAMLLTALMGLSIVLAAGASAVIQERKLQAATDIAALVAADTHRGLVSGIVCENALQILESVGFGLQQCRIVRDGVEIRGHSMVSFFRLESYAVAGAPNQ
jgi:uncharacterized membrane protein